MQMWWAGCQKGTFNAYMCSQNYLWVGLVKKTTATRQLTSDRTLLHFDTICVVQVNVRAFMLSVIYIASIVMIQ